MCLSLHLDSDGSINRTRKTLYLTHKKGSRQDSLQSFNPWGNNQCIPLFHNNRTPERSQYNFGLLKYIVILFSKAHLPISQVTQLLEQFPWKYLALHHRPCIWSHQHGLCGIPKKKPFWGNNKLKAKVCQWMQTQGPGFSMGIRHTAHYGQTPQLLWWLYGITEGCPISPHWVF